MTHATAHNSRDYGLQVPELIPQDPRQEKTILALQELYDQLRSGIRPRRPSGLTITDHIGPTKKRAHWQVLLMDPIQQAMAF